VSFLTEATALGDLLPRTAHSHPGRDSVVLPWYRAAAPAYVIEKADLRVLIIEVMPRFAVPRYLGFMEELPKTRSQRIEKYKLGSEGITPDTVDRHVMGIKVPRE
jgi:hypothetical protein